MCPTRDSRQRPKSEIRREFPEEETTLLSAYSAGRAESQHIGKDKSFAHFPKPCTNYNNNIYRVHPASASNSLNPTETAVKIGIAALTFQIRTAKLRGLSVQLRGSPHEGHNQVLATVSMLGAQVQDAAAAAVSDAEAAARRTGVFCFFSYMVSIQGTPRKWNLSHQYLKYHLTISAVRCRLHL